MNDPNANRGIWLRLLVWARRSFIPLAIGFLLWSAYVSGDQLGPLLRSLSVGPLALACICWSLAQWVGPLATLGFARAFGLDFGYGQLALIHVLRLPAKYLPGGIWQSVSRFAAYRSFDVRKSDAGVILIAEHLLALGTSATMGGMLLIFFGSPVFRTLEIWAVAGGFCILGAVAVMVGRIRGAGRQTLGGVMLAIGATAVFWIGAAASFCWYWSAALRFSHEGLLRVAGGYLVSWAAGFLAVFAPQGLGVFEWSAARLVASDQPMSLVVTLIAGFRLVAVCGDLLAWSIAIVLSKLSARASAASG